MIKKITEDIWDNRLLEVHNYFIMRARRQDPLLKKMTEKIIRFQLYSLVDYSFKNKNYKKMDASDFYDAYDDMVERALRNFDPFRKEETTFKSYFISGLGYKNKEQNKEEAEKNKNEKAIVEDKTFSDIKQNHNNTIRESLLVPEQSAEDEFFNNDIEEEKENRKKVLETMLKIVTDMIKIKESLRSKEKSDDRYFYTFFTSDNIALLRIGAKVNVNGKCKKATYIEPEEVLEVMQRNPEENYKVFDRGLLKYIYVLLPESLAGIAKDELKKNKDIMGASCKKPDEYIKIPLVDKDAIRLYLREIHGFDVTPQAISKGRVKYKKFLGEYYLPWE